MQHVAKPGFGLDSHRCRKRNEGNVVQYNKQLRDIRYKRYFTSPTGYVQLVKGPVSDVEFEGCAQPWCTHTGINYCAS